MDLSSYQKFVKVLIASFGILTGKKLDSANI